MGIDKTKQQKREAVRAMLRRVIAVVVAGVVIVAAMYAYNYATTSDRFAVKTIEFSGLTRVGSEEIEAMLGDLGGENLLLAPLESFEARLETHPRVLDVSLKRILPDRIVCTVTEREPVALIFVDRFYEVDRFGMVMNDDEFTSMLDLPIITGLSQRDLEADRINETPALREALDALALCQRYGGDFASDISELKVSSNGVTIRSLRQDCVVVLGREEHEKRLKKYFLLRGEIAQRDEEPRVIDLRFDNQVVVRGTI